MKTYKVFGTCKCSRCKKYPKVGKNKSLTVRKPKPKVVKVKEELREMVKEKPITEIFDALMKKNTNTVDLN